MSNTQEEYLHSLKRIKEVEDKVQVEIETHRKLIEEEFKKIFQKFDCILCPTVPRLPHKIGEKISIFDMFQYDALTCPINLSGDCAITIPSGEINKIPVGLQIICNKFNEPKLFQIANALEKI